VSLAPVSSRRTPAPQPRNAAAGDARRALVAVDDPPDPREAAAQTAAPHRAEALPATWSSGARATPRSCDPSPQCFGSMVGDSPPMRQIFEQIERVAPTDAAVLILGESGTGKELVAEAVHALSRRSAKPMISINCGALPSTLIESELFGHERGSFTGAGRVHRGHFERADGGTLFLDEVNEMPFELQVKLLRVLESGTFFRVGGDRPVVARVRIVAASKPNLERAVAEGRFRSDLLYRLRVFPICLPPLRERNGDLPRLVGHFMDAMNQDAGVEKRLSPAAMSLLDTYDWPGNVRELRHLLERAYILSESEIGPADLSGLPPPRAPVKRGEATLPGAVTLEPGISLADAERLFVLATLLRAGGNRTRTAAMLQISTKALRRRLREYQAQTRPASDDRAGTAGRCDGNGEKAEDRGGPYDCPADAARSGFLATVASK
jgi:DNA-binding NtrC family response regulator